MRQYERVETKYSAITHALVVVVFVLVLEWSDFENEEDDEND